jgi:hypothetical protein
MKIEFSIKGNKARLLAFFAAVLPQLALTVGLFFWLFPNVAHEESSKPWHFLLWVFLLGLPLSLFEYLYHRYLLHSAVLPFMGAMHRAHSTHHGLTSVKAPVTPKEPLKLVPVVNEYAVEEEHQEESMMFPLYSLPIFLAIFLVLMALPLKLLFPHEPIVFSVITAVALCYSAYEIWHVILHLPFERFWKPATERWFGKRVFRHMYAFHLMHHWRPTANLAIVGFWGVALWDHAFRTHHRPVRLPVPEAEVNYKDAALRKPLWPIRTFDMWQGRWYTTSRKIERFLARVFLRRTA